MKIVFFTMGTLGDVIPYIKIARRLQSKKRQVIFLSNELFREYITGHGFFFYPVGDRDTFNRVFSNPRTWSPEGVDQQVIDYHLPSYRPAYEFVRDLVGTPEVADDRDGVVVGLFEQRRVVRGDETGGCRRHVGHPRVAPDDALDLGHVGQQVGGGVTHVRPDPSGTSRGCGWP
jgi:hypothetical protein